jgi:hypothetical protein
MEVFRQLAVELQIISRKWGATVEIGRLPNLFQHQEIPLRYLLRNGPI